MKRFSTTMLLCGAGILACAAHASTMQFSDTNAPNNGISYNPSTGYIAIPFEITNNDLNTEYAYAVLNSAKPGLEALYNFDNNATIYTSLEYMLSTQTGGMDNMRLVLDGNQGYVNRDWWIGCNPDGRVEIKPDFPGYNLEEDWLDSINHPYDNDTAKAYIQIGSWLYDGDGVLTNFTLDPALVAPGDAIPVIHPDQFMPDAAVATTFTGHDIPATGNYLSLLQPQTTNGTPTAWLAEYNLSTDTTDPNNDGFQTLEEYIAATNPTNGLDFLKIGSGTTGLHFATASNRLYAITGSGNLVSNHWNTVTINLPGTGAPVPSPSPPTASTASTCACNSGAAALECADAVGAFRASGWWRCAPRAETGCETFPSVIILLRKIISLRLAHSKALRAIFTPTTSRDRKGGGCPALPVDDSVVRQAQDQAP